MAIILADDIAEQNVDSAAGQESEESGGIRDSRDSRDRCLQPLCGKPLLQHVIEGVRDSVAGLIINSNSHFSAYKEYGYPVVEDLKVGQHNPLVGIYSGLCWYSEQKADTEYVVSVPADVPLFPAGLVKELQMAAANSESGIAYVECEGKPQPLIAIWPLSAIKNLAVEITTGNSNCQDVLQKLGANAVAVSKSSDDDFKKVTTEAELLALEKRLNGTIKN